MRHAVLLAALFLAACNGPIRTDDTPPPPKAVQAGPNARLEPRESMLKVGAKIPAFTLNDQKGFAVSAGEITAGKGAVLCFVPPDDSAGARPVYEWVRKSQGVLSSRGLELLLVTPGDEAGNAAVAEREGLRLALLADPGSWVARAFGAVPERARSPQRPCTFVLGRDGRIQAAEPRLPDAAELIMAAETMPGIQEKSVLDRF